MNLILLYKTDFISDNKVVIKGRRLEHILSVHKASPGKGLTVGLLDGNLGKGIVRDISNDKIEMEITLTTPPPEPLPVNLIVALPRPKTLKKVLHIATALGIKNIFLLESWKVEKSYWQTPLLKKDEIEKHLVLGLEQARDTTLPKVIVKRRFKPFLEDDLPEIIKATTPFLAHPSPVKSCQYNFQKPVTLAIGPEGGFTDYEISKFTENGFKPISLGKRILRVEYAIPAIIGKLF